jgi:cobalt-zinc-cadmium efflux system membrane fusion protein
MQTTSACSLPARHRRWATVAANVVGIAATAWLLGGGCGDPERPRGENSRPPSRELLSTAASQPTPLVVVPPDSPRVRQLRVDEVRARPIATDEIVAPARIIVNPNRIARVLPFVQGRVLTVLARLGDPVAEGQPLVTLDSPDADAAISSYLQAEATVRQSAVTLSKTDADLRRARALNEDRIVSDKELLAAENDFATARTAADNARAAHEQALRKLELLGLTPTDFRRPVTIRAPIAGVITDIAVAPGEYRAALSAASDTTAPLMSIADLSAVWISSEVPEPFIGLVHVGGRVDLRLVAYPGETFTGHVARIASTLDAQTRTLRVYVDLPNPRGRFVPEMFGTIRLAGPDRTLPVVPAASIVQEYGRSLVFVERGPGQFERRPVTTGIRVGDLVAVVAGLEAGTRVVVDGAILLKGQ